MKQKESLIRYREIGKIIADIIKELTVKHGFWFFMRTADQARRFSD